MSDEVTREVDQLLDEREKYETWLQRLEDERDQASQRAYERVREDYRDRLAAITEELESHADALHSRLDELRTTERELEEQRIARSDELEEARLRRNVGEYDDDEWADLEAELSTGVEEVSAELETTRDEIDRLQAIVEQVEGGGAVAEPVPAEPEAAAGGASEAAQEPPPAEGPGEAVAAPASGPSDDDEVAEEDAFTSLEELVFGEGDEEVPAEPRQPADAAAPAEPEAEPTAAGDGDDDDDDDDEEVGDELAFLESLSLEGDSEEGDSFSFLDQGGRGEPQTIICAHCSAANDPAEWYCTECGEELPAE